MENVSLLCTKPCGSLVFHMAVIYKRLKGGVRMKLIPNQELSGAKSNLQRGTVGLYSSYKRGGRQPYNLPATHLRFTPRSLQVCLLAHFNK